MDRLKAPLRIANTLALFLFVYAMLITPSSAAPSAGPLAAPMGAGFEYHGRLNNVTGSYDFKFRLFNVPTGGSPVYATTAVATAVPVANGEYRTVLRFGAGVTQYLTGEILYVDVQYRVATSDPDAPYTTQAGERAQLMPTAFALSSRPGATVQGDVAAAGLFVRNTGAGTGVAGRSNTGAGTTGQSTSWYGVYGLSNTQAGVRGDSTSGAGVWGRSSTSAGVYGESSSWIGVHGVSSTQSGVTGWSTTFTGVWGESRDGAGVYGTSTKGDGMYGVTTALNKSGVAGFNNGSGAGYGVYGQSAKGRGVAGVSTSNAGVTGTSTSSTGVAGQSTSGTGTTGQSDNWYGVYGQSGSGAGVVGNSTTGYAMVAQGNASQSLAGGGFVKAMALIDPYDGADPIKQCYNGQLSGPQATSGNCGFTANMGGTCNSTRSINFGFNVSNRFISITPYRNAAGSIGANIIDSKNANSVLIETFYVLDSYSGNSAKQTCAKYFIVVY